jgi:hypothetical protein|nr:MAG TPA: hypothetical protein [Caudoviricetes sp.]
MSKTLHIIENRYFEWLFDLVCRGRYSENISYRKLLMHLYNTEFRYSLPKDRNRADDGIDLRYRFAITQGYEGSSDLVLDALDGPCSVLEMMVALAIRCEESIMDDPRMGDRTKQWFWGMITNLGLGSMMDDRFDRDVTDEKIRRFLDRKYAPNGKGGLFTIRQRKCDLRKVEIWYQLNYYLDEIT